MVLSTQCLARRNLHVAEPVILSVVLGQTLGALAPWEVSTSSVNGVHLLDGTGLWV
jgi:hypothetical protein